MSHTSVEITCTSCNQEALLIRRPLYDGFKRIGEELLCASCGCVFENEDEVPFKHKKTVQVFTEADRPADIEVFEKGPAPICRHCQNYTVNPFTQWCSLHKKEVAATDSCGQFKLLEVEKEDGAED